MLRVRLLALLFPALLLGTGSGAMAAARIDWEGFAWDVEYEDQGEFVEGMVLPGFLVLRFEEGATPANIRARGDGLVFTGRMDLDRAAENTGAYRLERVFPELPQRLRDANDPERDLFYVVRFDSERTSVREAAQAWAQVEGVVTVEPSPVHRMHATLPNDPALSQQWWLRTPNYGFADIRAVAAWYHSTGDPDAIVCVADSGVDWRHPDLGGTGPDYIDGVIWTNSAELYGTAGVDDDGNGKVDDFRGWDFVDGVTGLQTPPQDVNNQDNNPMDYGGHGTAVAGCIAAISNNGYGIASSNWNSKIMACRIGWTTASGEGMIGLLFAAQALDYARINGATVFNASWGSSNYSPFVNAVNSYLNGGQRVLVVSAGNDNNEVAEYLNARPDCVSVAATNSSDAKAGFSSFGVWVDISAPGVSIYTTSYNPSGSGGSQHTFTSTQGTSFSSPIVAGAFALAKSVWPGEGRVQLTNRVLAAVDDLDAKNPSYAGKLGTGRLNLAKLFDNGQYWRVPEQMPTLFDAINTAAAGDTIAVLGGVTLPERMSIPAGIDATIIGGFDPTYTTWDPVGNRSVLQPVDPAGPIALFNAGVGPNFHLEGFHLTGGRAQFVGLSPVNGYYGGGVAIRDASPTLKNLLISGNIAGASSDYGAGGGLSVIGGNPLIEDCEITGNSALRGPGVYVYRATPTFRNVLVHDNTNYPTGFGEDAVGGNYYVVGAPAPRAGGVSVVIEGGRIENGNSEHQGGGIYAEGSDLQLDGVTLHANQSQLEGAGIFLQGGSLTMTDCVVTDNLVAVGSFEEGGGVYANSSSVAIDGSTFSGNYSSFAGGAIAAFSPVSLSVTNSLVVDNAAQVFGAGTYVSGGPAGMSFEGNTYARNSGGSLGANALYIQGGDGHYQQNVFASNGGAGATAEVNFVGSAATFSCNLAWDNFAGNYAGVTDPTGSNGNIVADPLFCDAPNGDYTISPASPAATAACGFMGATEATCTGTAVEELPTIARRFELQQNVPNPFNPRTRITFSLAQEGPARLVVYDVRGREVVRLHDGPLPAGEHVVVWNGVDRNGRSVASGTYFYEFRAGGQRFVRKMGLLK